MATRVGGKMLTRGEKARASHYTFFREQNRVSLLFSLSFAKRVFECSPYLSNLPFIFDVIVAAHKIKGEGEY